MISSENIKRVEIAVKTFISNKLPMTLWTDSSRLLQIMMNLVSNTLKFTPNKGKIQIYVDWCSPKEAQDKLLKLIKLIPYYSCKEKENTSNNKLE